MGRLTIAIAAAVLAFAATSAQAQIKSKHNQSAEQTRAQKTAELPVCPRQRTSGGAGNPSILLF